MRFLYTSEKSDLSNSNQSHKKEAMENSPNSLLYVIKNHSFVTGGSSANGTKRAFKLGVGISASNGYIGRWIPL
ncbi:hypothetical protein CAPN008_10150 [Capnocytophaga canis]|nr:hypothetical protein CAPN008_10150 [Capnocytophaga canis]